MKRLLLAIALVISLPISLISQSFYYTCVMHPEIHASKPGNCPKCGMNLIKKNIKATPAKPVAKPPVSKPSVVKPVTAEQTAEQPAVPKDSAVTQPAMPKPQPVTYLPSRKVTYHLYVTDTIVNYTGKNKHAYAINGTIPGPVLYFNEGDTAEIVLHNMLKKEETSLHWHGVFLPNRFDGVPYLTTKRIGPGDVYTYTFPVIQNGTYWYHSHSKLQEQAGMYGSLVFNERPRAPQPASAESINSPMPQASEYSLVLSEWTDDKPEAVQRRLRSANDWYAIKKGSVQSYAEAIQAKQFNTKFINELKRMKAMDVSDVYYNKFLINGKPSQEINKFKPGERVRLRVINAGASSYFWLGWAGGKMTVVASDGNEVDPVEVDRLIVGVSETYDVMVDIPASGSYEFRATPEDRTGAASLWLGSGPQKPAPVMPRLTYFDGMKMMNSMMKGNGQMADMKMDMSNQQMDMNMVMYPEIADSTPVTLNYAMLRNPVSSVLPAGPGRTFEFTLTGNMNRYVWSINNKTVLETDKIRIAKGENIRIILYNASMMRHPMHLHGHDFRIINGQGDYAPLKNVIDIMPMERDTIEFAANAYGDWFFHCHILYHMMAGMGNIFSYSNSPVNPDLPDQKQAWRRFRKDNRMIHGMANIGLESNGSDGEFMLMGNRFELQGMWHLGLHPHHGYEAELNFGRYLGINQWVFPYIGFDYHYNEMMDAGKNLFGQQSNKDNRKTVVAGIQYTLPLLFVADGRVDGNGKFRFQLGREDIPLSPRLRMAMMGNTDKEYMAGLKYIVKKWFAVSTHYDSDMGLGVGVTLTY